MTTNTTQRDRDRQRESVRRFEALLRERGIRRYKWCREAGVSFGTLHAYLDEARTQELSPATLRKLAQAATRLLGRPVASWEITGGSGGVEVWGILADGAVTATGATRGGADQLPAPPTGEDPADYMAIEVVDDSAAPWAAPGDILYVAREPETDPAAAVGRRCIVETEDGAQHLATLQHGPQAGTYTLLRPSGAAVRTAAAVAAVLRVRHQTFA